MRNPIILKLQVDLDMMKWTYQNLRAGDETNSLKSCGTFWWFTADCCRLLHVAAAVVINFKSGRHIVDTGWWKCRLLVEKERSWTIGGQEERRRSISLYSQPSRAVCERGLAPFFSIHRTRRCKTQGALEWLNKGVAALSHLLGFFSFFSFV